MIDQLTARRFYKIREMWCHKCVAYKPKQKGHCRIAKHLLEEQQPDMIANERCFLDGFYCKGYVYSPKTEDKWNGKDKPNKR